MLYLQVVPGELTIVTGLSNSGKSEWLDALTVNLAQENGWNIAVCSLENTPREHGRKLMEKYLGEAALNGTLEADGCTVWYPACVPWQHMHFNEDFSLLGVYLLRLILACML